MPQTISEDDVRHVAKLSRLRMDDDEVAHFTQQLAAVLEYMAKLNELDLDDVEPMAHPTEIHNVLRPDEPSAGLTTDQALANAPAQAPPFFRVPKVIDTGGSA